MHIASHFALDLLRHLVTPTFVLDATGQVVIWNRACERLTGVMADQVLNTRQHWRAFYQHERPTLADIYLNHSHHLLLDGYEKYQIDPQCHEGVIQAENWMPMPFASGSRYLSLDVGPVHDDKGGVIAVVQTMRDMTECKQTEDALRQSIIADTLTGLGNRRYFDRQFQAVWQRCRRYQHPLTLLLIEIDDILEYARSFGKEAEQGLFVELARVLNACTLRPDDECFRYSSSIFAVLLPDTAARGAWGVANRIKQQLYDFDIPHACNPHGRVTASIGMASVLPNSEADTTVIFNEANAAMYEAKQRGPNSMRQWFAYELAPVFTQK